MTLKLDGGSGFFKINEEMFPAGRYRIVLSGDNVGLREENFHMVVNPTDFSIWRDSTDSSYANRAALITDLKAQIFT